MAKQLTWQEIKSRIFKNWISLFSLPLTFLLIEQIQKKSPISEILPTVGGILASLLGYDKKKPNPSKKTDGEREVIKQPPSNISQP